jgi:competence protein ComGC
VFVTAAGMAGISLILSLMIPRHPVKGQETIFSKGIAAVVKPQPTQS